MHFDFAGLSRLFHVHLHGESTSSVDVRVIPIFYSGGGVAGVAGVKRCLGYLTLLT